MKKLEEVIVFVLVLMVIKNYALLLKKLKVVKQALI